MRNGVSELYTSLVLPFLAAIGVEPADCADKELDRLSDEQAALFVTSTFSQLVSCFDSGGDLVTLTRAVPFVAEAQAFLEPDGDQGVT